MESQKATTGATPVTGLMGERGGTIIAGTGAVSGSFNCLYPLSDTVINTMTLGADFTGTMNSIALTAGIPFYGRFTAVTLTSGSAVAYLSTTHFPGQP